MKGMIGLLMVVGMVVGVVGCGDDKDSPTGPTKGPQGLPIQESWDNGQIKSEGNYKNGNKDGKWVWYYESGKVKWEVNYVDGKQEGKWVRYYESGKVWWEGNYVNGKKGHRETKSLGPR